MRRTRGISTCFKKKIVKKAYGVYYDSINYWSRRNFVSLNGLRRLPLSYAGYHSGSDVTFKQTRNRAISYFLLKVKMFLVTSKPVLRGLRFQKLNYRFNSRWLNITTFIKKGGYQANRYHKTSIQRRKLVPMFKFNERFLKGWLYCIDLISTTRKYYSIFKNLSGITYVTPLIDSVALGDRIRLYRNATRFYYFIKTGSVVPIKFLRTGFMLCQIGINTPIIALSAGTYVLLNTFNQSGINITLPSGKHVIFGYNYFGFIGRNSGAFTYKQYYGKFSRPDYMHRIIVRSCAKNPVDHPNGGRTRGKQLMKTPWGLVARSSK